ncbi:Hsp70 family protein [Pandoraea sp.]|uniref:Hsp70 family protein n=1 Tax=Pandoraea sp. TaxID=1883445 RepID=UPI001214B170|nr:Hsp70 family protein [Pandoraea sp.]MDE2287408.1 Hsp70 family protein [Burkholderiales bacterium]MDE2610959.1 Hsp70 family protein [Burkholderiales bacterium]TAL52678.1 MAG: Hsp70 family protein [Pandoraea sp.]TAM16319.1 MAG: Hsp70 family protein [Pandoraea sp.]
MSFCAIDFGTSNSAVALPEHAGIRLATLEGTQPTMPTAVFFNADENSQAFGRAAIAAYIDGYDGRLMRSLKSILGSPLLESATDIGGGRSMRYLDVIATFLRQLKHTAEQHARHPIERVVLGRPVFFVDDDPASDAAAQRSLTEAARQVGFKDIEFQFEPIAAAFDYESRLETEQLVLVADIGGGTSDFSLVRVGPQRMRQLERKSDVLAHYGVHVAGTDFDRRVEMATILREMGYKTIGTDAREIPNGVYFDLATWHLINTIYGPKRSAEIRLMRHLYADPIHHDRLMRTVTQRLGHALAGCAEDAKIAVAAGSATRIDLELLEEDLSLAFDEHGLIESTREETQRIVAAATHTARAAGVAPQAIDALYFTGGSTGLRFLSNALAAAFPNALPVAGDRLASVATGLGIHARRIFS